MATRDSDGFVPSKWASSGDASSPPFSRDTGWTLSYSQAGGSAPARTTFNQLFLELSALALDLNKFGAAMPWDTNVTYEIYAVVTGSDGETYKSLITANSANDPISDDGTKWQNQSAPTPTRETLTGNTTFTYNGKDELLLILDPDGAIRTVNPSGTFPDGFKVTVINIGLADLLTFDSTGLGESVSPGDKQSFYYLLTEDEWR